MKTSESDNYTGQLRNGREIQKKKNISKYYPPAIEISSSAIKLLQLCQTRHNVYEPARFAYLPFEQRVVSAAVIRGALEKLVWENSLSGEVVSSLSMAELQTFTYIFPDMPASEIEPAVIWKLKQNPPAGIEFGNLAFDYVSSASVLTKGLCVLVFAVSREAVIERSKLFREFSLSLISLEPKPYAVLQALFWSKSIAKDETVLVLQIGAQQSVVSVIYNGFPCLIRSLNVCGNTLTDSLAKQNQLDWQQAEDLKKMPGSAALAIGSQTTAFWLAASGPALSSQLESLSLDIEHSFKYFSHQLIKSPLVSFRRLILCGGAAQLAGLDKFLAQRLAVNVEVFHSPLISENVSDFTSALGLAVRHIEK